MGAAWPAACALAAAALSAAALPGPSTPGAPFYYILLGFWAIFLSISSFEIILKIRCFT